MTQRLNNLKNRDGAQTRVKRYGCGESSGHGKTSGRGGKGQTARSGGSLRLGFEGGQMPLIRRIPKRGFNNTQFGDEYAVINVGTLDALKSGSIITPESLAKSGIVKDAVSGLKILGTGQLTKKLTVRAHQFSESARKAIEAAGGACEIIPLAKPRPVAEAPAK